MLNKLYNFIFKHRLRTNLRILLSQKYSIRAVTDISNKKNWTAEMENDILKVLNLSTIMNLSRYIDSSLAEQIVKDRKENGPFNSLIELSNKIPYDNLSKLYHLYSDDKKRIKKFLNYVTPDIRSIQIPETILGVHIGFETISWAVVTYDKKILDLDCILWTDRIRLNSYILADMVIDAFHQLPSSNCYVFEELQGIPKFMKVRNHQRQLTVGIMSCIKLRNEQKNLQVNVLEISDGLLKGDNVYILRPLTVANFYKLRVGNEVIATQYITNKLFDNVNEGEAELRPICINNETKHKFNNKCPEHKEEIGCSLLKALMFAHLLELFNANKPACKTSDNCVI